MQNRSSSQKVLIQNLCVEWSDYSALSKNNVFFLFLTVEMYF